MLLLVIADADPLPSGDLSAMSPWTVENTVHQASVAPSQNHGFLRRRLEMLLNSTSLYRLVPWQLKIEIFCPLSLNVKN